MSAIKPTWWQRVVLSKLYRQRAHKRGSFLIAPEITKKLLIQWGYVIALPAWRGLKRYTLSPSGKKIAKILREKYRAR